VSKTAVIIVDLQQEYLPTGKLPLHQLAPALDKAAAVITRARQQGVPVIHIRHEQPGAPFFVPGSAGVEIIPQVAPQAGETVIVKNHPNSFRETGLEQLLKSEGITDVIILGAMSHMCIAATGRAAAELGFATSVVEDGCATLDLEHGGITVPAPQVHAANMAALAFAYASVVPADEVLAG